MCSVTCNTINVLHCAEISFGTIKTIIICRYQMIEQIVHEHFFGAVIHKISYRRVAQLLKTQSTITYEHFF